MEIALWIDTPALGDTIAAIPTLRKISEAYGNQPITVFTTKPFLFENHPLVKQAFKSDADKSNYMVYRTFSPLVGKQYDQHGTKIEFRYSNMDFRQFHAVSLGFTLQQHEMEMDLYIERERELPVKDYVIIHPTHTWPTRTWDREKWQALVDELNSRGIPVVAVGRDSREVGFYNTEKPVMDIDIKLGVNLLNDPDNDPAELRWMMNHRARAVVTMDSGMLHIAGTTDVNILQLGSSIDNKLRAPYRGPNISQDYKYAYANGGCEVFCSSNMKSNVQVHGSIQGVPPQVKCLENRPTFECHPTVDQALQELLKLIGYDDTKMDKAYVMHCDENYLPIVENSIKTVREFSQLPIIVYVINSDAKVNVPGVITHRLDFDIRQGDTFIETAEGENKFIQRNSQAVYDIITKKADACKHALENYANTIVYLDGDIVATHKIDELFDYPVNSVDYPLCTTASYEYMMMNGAGSPFPENEGEVFDLTKTIETDVCNLLGVNIWNRNYPLNYVQTGFILAGQNSLPFIQEWIDLCNLPEIANNHNRYAPYHEETLFNVLRWKYNYRGQLPFVYVNANSVETVKNIFYNTKYDGRNYVIQPNFGSRTGRFNDIKAFHGEKRPEVIKEMVNEIKRFQAIEENTSGKKRLVFLAPHLSTGGMPEFLLHRIKALQDQDEFEIHVIEYNMYAHTFVVQRTQIESLVEGRFYSLGDLGVEQELRETRLLRLLETINPDVIHIEECPEAFDSFNKMSEETQLAIYDKSKPWKIVETCHNIWFNPEEGKRFSPDAYAFVTPHHELETFAKENSTKQQVLFPIIEQSVSDTARRKMLEVFGFPTQSNQYHLINIGLWTPGKNQGEAIEWARALEAESPGTYQFHFVGNQASNFEHYWGPLMKDLPANCHIHGERSDVDSFYQIADAIVFNSTWECNPLTVRQSLGYPLPVIARNLPQYHDMYAGQLVEITGDTAEDLLRLKEALQAPKPERTNEYTMARFKKEHLDLYMQTLNGPQKRSQDKKAYTITWDAGPKVTSKVDREIEVDFHLDGKSVYSATLKGQGHWCKPAIQYWADWTVYVDGEAIQLDHSAPQIVQFDSSSLGDTLSWMEPCVEFKKAHNMDKLYVATHKNWLFDVEHYRALGIEFIKPGEWPTDAVALWRVGVYMEDPGGQVWFPSKNPRDWRKIYLGDIASDALGIGQVMRSPKLTYSGRTQQKRPYICIATASTAQAKYWNHPTGWQDLVNHYKAKGYDVYHISKEDTDLKGIKKAPEDLKDVYRLLQGAELFFGISSGLSWFAWATDVPVVLISGFTPEICEFDDDKTLRIINKDVCNSCWFKHHFNRGDWNWCPEHKGTERMFECTKSISAEAVIAQVDAWALQVEKETVNAYDHN